MVEIDFSKMGVSKDDLSIVEYDVLDHLNIRGASDNEAFNQAIKKVLDINLPTEANTFIEVDGNTILWLGPNEWLILLPQGEAPGLEAKLRQALVGVFSSVNEVSGGNMVLELSGDKVRELLLKGCPLDLHSSVFKNGQCAQSVLGKTSVTLWQVDEEPVFRMIVRRSFADYLGHWLIDAAREFR